MQQNTLSIIIPAFNAQDTIVETLDSIYSVGLQDGTFEVIIIDDCSTDNTVSVINTYAQTHSNIVLLRQFTNQRQGAARNRGLKIAKGKYVVLVDADDLVVHGLTKVLDVALTTNVDIMHCGMILQRNNLEQIVVSCAPKNEILTIHEFLEKWHTVETCQSPCAYLYKNELLKNTNIPFVEGKRLEDTDWVEKNLYAAKSIMCVDDIIYIYKENVNSTMHTTKYDTCADWWHFSYRRYLFANTIKDNMPQYAERLMDAAKYGIIANTTFRRLTRFSLMDYWRIRKRCGTECITYLSSMRWTGFTKIALCYPIIALLCLLLSCPIAKYSRLTIHALRNLAKK